MKHWTGVMAVAALTGGLLLTGCDGAKEKAEQARRAAEEAAAAAEKAAEEAAAAAAKAAEEAAAEALKAAEEAGEMAEGAAEDAMGAAGKAAEGAADAAGKAMEGAGKSGEGAGGEPSRPARSYLVEPGDTLSFIALDEYGSPGRYLEIFEANRDKLSDPHTIYAGQTLAIP